MNIHEWLDYGVERGFCSEVVCATHDGLPDIDDETDAWDRGDDPCVPAVRLYDPEAQKTA